jgi:hypothetical protein
LTSNLGNLTNPQSYIGTDHVMVGDGSRLPISHIGNTKLDSYHGKLELQDVLIMPDIKKKKFSFSKLTKYLSCAIEFISYGSKIKDKITELILALGSLYALHEEGTITILAAIKFRRVPRASLAPKAWPSTFQAFTQFSI